MRSVSHNRNEKILDAFAEMERQSVKAQLNPLIERIGTTLFGVDQYADIFEKIALAQRARTLWPTLLPRRIAADIASAQLLFIHVPKNGGTSVKRALYSSNPGHATIRYYELFFPDYLARAQTLALIREPVERFLSGFDFLMNGGGGDVRIQQRPMQRMRHIKTVDDFLEFLEAAEGDWFKIDTFARPQHWYIVDHRKHIRVKHLWLLDKREGFREFMAAYGAQDIPHANRTRRKSRSLTGQQLERVKRLYAEDFALYQQLRASGGYSSALVGVPASASSLAVTSASMAS